MVSSVHLYVLVVDHQPCLTTVVRTLLVLLCDVCALVS